MKHSKISFFISLSIGCFIFFACKKNDPGNIIPSNIKCINASPDAPAINFLDNNTSFAENLNYTDVSAYTLLAPVTSKLSITENSIPKTFNTFFTTLEPGFYYSLFAVDSFSKLSMTMVSDVFTIPATDSSMIRFFNFSPGSSYITATLENPLDTIFLGNRQFNDQNTYAAYVVFNEIPSGNYNLQLLTSDSTIISTPLNFSGGKVYTIYAKGFSQGTGISALGAALIEHN
ncbi:MAG: DUF4397 domain-containing protein [Chitinophagaceae bacterium]